MNRPGFDVGSNRSGIGTSIKSVWMLELLLLLRRRTDQAWRPSELVRELRGSESIVSQGLSGLLTAGLIVEEEGKTYRYAPATAHLDGLAQRLEASYAQRPGAVVKAILTAPNDKLQNFADAFRFTKD